MFRRIVAVVLSGAIAVNIAMAQTHSDQEQAAVSAALKWLTEIDKDKYAESWNHASKYFKNAINQAQWVESLQAVRKPLGDLISREVKKATYKTTLPGAPDGEYVVIQFQTSFVNKRSAIETVTPMLDKSGQWRVTGYYIK